MADEESLIILVEFDQITGQSTIRFTWSAAENRASGDPNVKPAACIQENLSLDKLVKYTRQVCACIERTEADFSDDVAWENFWSGEPCCRPISTNLTHKSVPACLSTAVLFGGICQYLARADRMTSYRAERWMLFAAWQYYNLLKWLYLTPFDEPEQKDIIIHELAYAYRHLSNLVESRSSAAALRWLSDKVGLEKSGGLFRENLLIGMVLRPIDDRGQSFSPSQLLQAPGVGGKNVWKKVALHPAFVEDEGGLTALRNLITGKIINRYDYSTALYLARLIKVQKDTNHTSFRRQFFTPQFWLLGGLVAIVWVAGWSLLISLVSGGDVGHHVMSAHRGIGLAVLICLGPLVYLGLFFSTLHLEVLPYLFLPRLVGGISLAYGALVFEGAHEFIAPLWSQDYWLILMIWIAVLLLVFIYLYQDILPLVRDKTIAFWRALSVLLVSLVISITFGLLATAVLTAPSLNSVGSSQLFFGPFGWVDWQQLFVIIPIGLLTGLVTQFMFEEKTVTAPVWAPEED